MGKDSIQTGARRKNMALCECQANHPRQGGGIGVCQRSGTMHDGMYVCAPCWRSKPHRAVHLKAAGSENRTSAK